MAAYPPKRGFKKMKKTNRWISALLAAVLLLSVSLTAAAEDVTVFIPGRLAKLQLPDSAESFDGDPFNTGVEGAVTTLVWDDATIQTSCGGYKKLDYIRQVIVTYPEGNYIRKVVAGYGNDKKKSLTKYTITYQTGEKEYYTVSYAPKTNTVVEDHYNGSISYTDHGTKTYMNVDTGSTVTVNADANLPSATLFKDSTGGVYLHHYDQDEILEATYTDGSVTLKSGSGNKANAWYVFDSVKGIYVPSGRAGLRAPKSFKSPRVQ